MAGTLPEPFYEADGITVYCADNREVLPLIERVDHVITDPPYSEKVHKASRRAGDIGKSGAGKAVSCSGLRVTDLGFESIKREDIERCADRFADICARWCLIFSDVELCHEWRAELVTGGLEYVRTGAWIKVGCSPQFTGDRPAVGFEAVTIAHPVGKKRWNGGGAHAVWSVPIVLNRGGIQERVHTTQKPIQLMRELVRLFTDPGELVIDCFAGSGTTGVACRELGRRAILIEREEKHCAAIVERLRQPLLPGTVPVAAVEAEQEELGL